MSVILYQCDSQIKMSRRNCDIAIGACIVVSIIAICSYVFFMHKLSFLFLSLSLTVTVIASVIRIMICALERMTPAAAQRQVEHPSPNEEHQIVCCTAPTINVIVECGENVAVGKAEDDIAIVVNP